MKYKKSLEWSFFKRKLSMGWWSCGFIHFLKFIQLLTYNECILLHANYASIKLFLKNKLSAAPHTYPSTSHFGGSAHVLVPVWNIFLFHFHNSTSDYSVTLNETPTNCAFKIRYVRTFPSTPKFLCAPLQSIPSTPPAQATSGLHSHYRFLLLVREIHINRIIYI